MRAHGPTAKRKWHWPSFTEEVEKTMPDFVVYRTRTIKECANVNASDEDEAEEKADDLGDESWAEQDEDVRIDRVFLADEHEAERDFDCE